MKILKKLDKIIAAILKYLVIGLCVAIGVILFVRVIVRFTPLHVPLSWTDEVVEWMMAWMIFTGATLIMRDGGHFRVDLLQERFAGRRWVNVLNIFIAIMGLGFFITLLYYSIDLTVKATWFSPIMKVSQKVPYLSIPVNCALIIIYQIRDIVSEVILFINHNKNKEAQAAIEDAKA